MSIIKLISNILNTSHITIQKNLDIVYGIEEENHLTYDFPNYWFGFKAKIINNYDDLEHHFIIVILTIHNIKENSTYIIEPIINFDESNAYLEIDENKLYKVISKDKLKEYLEIILLDLQLKGN